MTFGEKFKAEREKRKLTQQEVADALGINRRMITRYENGISFPRTKDAYRKIAEYFKVLRLDVPSTTTPSSGTFSPGWTTMMLPTATTSGSTCVS